MTMQTIALVNNMLRNANMTFDTAPDATAKAAKAAQAASAKLSDAEINVQDAQRDAEFVQQQWLDVASDAVAAGKEMPAKTDVDKAEVTAIAMQKLMLKQRQEYNDKISTLANLLDDEANRDEWVANIETELVALANIMRNDEAGAFHASMRYVHLLQLSYFIGAWGIYPAPPEFGLPSIVENMTRILNEKPWVKPVPGSQNTIHTVR